MALTVSEVLARARALNADVQTGGISNQDMVYLLNQVIEEDWLRLTNVQPYLLQPQTATISYSVGVQEYDLPATLDRVELVEVTDFSPSLVLVEERFENRDNYPLSGEPYAYYVVGKRIGFLPAPDRSATNNVRVTYIQDAPTVAYDAGGSYLGQALGLPEELHPAVVYELAALMRERDQLPSASYGALAERYWRRFLGLAFRGRGQGVQFMQWVY